MGGLGGLACCAGGAGARGRRVVGVRVWGGGRCWCGGAEGAGMGVVGWGEVGWRGRRRRGSELGAPHPQRGAPGTPGAPRRSSSIVSQHPGSQAPHASCSDCPSTPPSSPPLPLSNPWQARSGVAAEADAVLQEVAGHLGGLVEAAEAAGRGAQVGASCPGRQARCVGGGRGGCGPGVLAEAAGAAGVGWGGGQQLCQSKLVWSKLCALRTRHRALFVRACLHARLLRGS